MRQGLKAAAAIAFAFDAGLGAPAVGTHGPQISARKEVA
jgi:hypothetical protein